MHNRWARVCIFVSKCVRWYGSITSSVANDCVLCVKMEMRLAHKQKLTWLIPFLCRLYHFFFASLSYGGDCYCRWFVVNLFKLRRYMCPYAISYWHIRRSSGLFFLFAHSLIHSLLLCLWKCAQIKITNRKPYSIYLKPYKFLTAFSLLLLLLYLVNVGRWHYNT